MDAWQLANQAAYLLTTAAYADAPSQSPLAGGVVISDDDDGNFLGPTRAFEPDGGPTGLSLPFARVSPRVEMKRDPESPGRVLEARIHVYVTAGGGGVAGEAGQNDVAAYDSHGINIVTGALRSATQGQGKNTGRDVNETVTELVRSSLNGGVLVPWKHAIQGEVEDLEEILPTDAVQVLTRHFVIVAQNATFGRTYAAPIELAAVAAAGHAINLSWVLPPATPALYSIILKRGSNPGDPAPTSPTTGGTTVPVTGGLLGTSAADAGSGSGQTFNYAAWAGYTETAAAKLAGVPDRYTDFPALVTGVTT